MHANHFAVVKPNSWLILLWYDPNIYIDLWRITACRYFSVEYHRHRTGKYHISNSSRTIHSSMYEKLSQFIHVPLHNLWLNRNLFLLFRQFSKYLSASTYHRTYPILNWHAFFSQKSTIFTFDHAALVQTLSFFSSLLLVCSFSRLVA